MCCCVPGLAVSDVLSSRVRLSKKNSYSSWTPSPLKMKALYSFKMLGTAGLAIWCHIPEDLNPYPFDLF